MNDPGIPRNPSRKAAQTTVGRFIDKGNRVVLASDNGGQWELSSVSIVTGGFGFKEDGSELLPRPWLYDVTQQVIVEGDIVLIQFRNNNGKLPIVMGGLRSATDVGFLARGYQDEVAPYNRLAIRRRALSTLGLPTGDARVEVHGARGADDPGVIKVSSTQRIEILVAPNLDTDAGAIWVTVENGVVTVENGGITEKVLKGETFSTDSAAALTEITAALAALGFAGLAAAHIAALTAGAYTATTLEAE